MLPSVNLRKKRSKSKLSCDFTESPYGKLHSKSGTIKSLTCVKQASPANYKLGFMDSLSETSKFKDFKRNLIDQTFDFSGKLMKPEDYEALLREYNRIFKDNPEFLINYKNIVSQMIEQCEVIKDQKKEIKRLKRIEETHSKLIRDLTKSSFFDSSISDESPSMIKH